MTDDIHSCSYYCTRPECVRTQRDQLRDELTALRRDAERYRWLRGEADVTGERWSRWNLQRWDGRSWHSLELTALDAAIDAAMGEKV